MTQSTRFPSQLKIEPIGRPVDAEVELPGSKSYTNRALPIAALANGASVLRGALFSDDTAHMAESLRRLEIQVREDEARSEFIVRGASGSIPASRADLFVGNSGTSARFLTAIVAAGEGTYTIDGVERMRSRPISPLLDALQQLGVQAESIDGTGCPPVRVVARGIAGGTARLDGTISSQYLTALLIVAPLARSDVSIEIEGELVSKPYVDMTGAIMGDFGVAIERDGYRRFLVRSGQQYQPRDYAIEADASAASYFFALAAATGGRIRVRNLTRGSLQGDLRFVEVLERMGCRVSWLDDAVEVQGPARLNGIDVDMNPISDTVQTLAAIAPLADGPVTVRNVEHIRAKETDRLAALTCELRRIGIEVSELADGLVIQPGESRGGVIQTYDDHRMAMSFAILGCATPGITIENPGCVTKTFPGFFDVLAAATGRR